MKVKELSIIGNYNIYSVDENKILYENVDGCMPENISNMDVIGIAAMPDEVIMINVATLKKFSVCIIETNRVYYTVEAHSEEEAAELFRNRDETLDKQIMDDLADGYEGTEMSVVSAEPDEEIDFTYAELKGEN